MRKDAVAVIAALKKKATKRNRQGLARYGIVARNPLGVYVGDIRALAKRIGPDQTLAVALWKTDIYEARLLAAFVAESERVTSSLMDRWARDFDNWALCDTLCFHLFDKTPYAWAKIEKWSNDKSEFVKRAALALLASMALHDKKAPDRPFQESLRLIERAATDERNFVKKAVSWALRGIGRRNRALNAEAVKVAQRLITRDGAARWIGRDALRYLTSRSVQNRVHAETA